MKKTTLIKSIEEAEHPAAPKFIILKKNLIQIGFFSVPRFAGNKKEPKQEKLVKFTRVETDKVSSHVEILAPRKVGLPTTGDLTKYLAFQDLVQEKYVFDKQNLSEPITFTNYELLSRLGRRMSGESYKEVQDWLLRMKSTTVQFVASDGRRNGSDVVSVFDRVISYNEKLDDGSIADCNYVWLSNWEIENLLHKSLVPIDLITYRQIENETAKMLVPHLQIWLYASRNKPPFDKNYEDFCVLLGIRQYSTLKEITRKLKPAMDALEKYRYIEKWQVTGTRARGFKILIWHGTKFFNDLKIFFVLDGGKKDEDKTLDTRPAALPPLLTGEQKQMLDKLIEKELDAGDAEAIVRTLDVEDIELRLKYCAFRFAKAPEKYESQGGYIYKILTNEKFKVPNSVLEKISLREEKSRQIGQQLKEQESEERDAAKDLWLRGQFDEFCFHEAQKESSVVFLLFASEFNQGLEIWEKISEEIKQALNPQIYGSWFTACCPVSFDSETLTLQVATSDVTKEWIETYYQKNILEAQAKLNLSDYRVELVISELPAEGEDKDFFFYRLTLIQEYKQKGILSLDEFYAQNREKLDADFEQFYQSSEYF